MSPLNVLATVLITFALIFCSVGVWLVRLVPYIDGMFLGMAA